MSTSLMLCRVVALLRLYFTAVLSPTPAWPFGSERSLMFPLFHIPPRDLPVLLF